LSAAGLLALIIVCSRQGALRLPSGKIGGTRYDFARERQALATFGFAAQFGESRHRAIAARCARCFANLIFS
jgi:hypothetical protein